MENALGAVGEAQASAVQHMAMQQLMPGMGLASCGVPVICCEVEEEEEDTTATGRFLRLCVHHGKNLPKVACFAEVVFDTGKASEVRERSAPVGACFCPTWDLQVEHSLRRKLPSVEVLIKTSGCIPRQVAHGWLVPVENGSEVQVVELELGTSTGFCEEEVQKVVVAYQLVNSGDLRLDLARAADLGTAGVQQSKFRLQALVRGVQFKHSLNAGEEVRLRVYTMHSSGLTEDKEIRRSVDAEAKSVKKLEFGDSAKGDEEMLWELVASEVSLGRYDLVVEAYLRPEGTEAEVVGVWSEPLNQLYDTIHSRQLKLLFRAHLRKGLRHTGYLELMLDLHRVSDAPHQTPLIAQNRKAVLQARKGRREEGDEQFYVHVAALGLQVPCPYLKVISAGDSGATDEFEADESKKRCGEWVKSLPVKTTSSNSQVRLELWADSSETLLLGQTLIFDGFPDRPPCWRHLFGAAELAREPEAAEKMARGRLEPSTHRASLHVTFSRFSGKLPEKLSEMRNTQTPVQLTVRFYRALYLDRYAGSRVQVRVQLAGCMAGESKDVLAFDAKVDERGVARFSESGAHGKTNAWVEKSSSLLSIPQDVSSAYFYIVRQGEEGYAPEVYGKIPLSFSKAKVDWVEARCDASAAEAPRWAEVQGMVLGSAHVTRVQEAEPKESSAEEVPGVEVYCHLDFLAARCLPSADEDNLVDPCYEVRVEDQSLQLKSPVRRTLNPTFLHRLLIGPIRLPEVKVADGKLSEEQPVSLPPVHIRITDKDEGFMGSTSYTPLGQAFLVDPKILDGEAKHAEGGGLVLDVNQSHRAFWYALGDNKHIPFDHVLDPAWVSRPRILAAAGYSCTASTVTRAQQDERQADPQICRIYTEHSLKYDITVDVLGVRELQNYGTKLELALTPFWSSEGSKKAKKIYIGLDHSNTGKGRAESPGASEFRQRMEPLINWAAKDAIETPPVLDEDAAGADNSSDSEEEDNSGEWRPLKLKTSQSRGWRVSVSNYSAPIIPYLQVSFHKQLPKTEAPKDPSAQAEAAADRAKPLLAPFVLLPDLVFSVKDQFSGDDLGSVCVMLPVNHRHLSVAKQMSEALRLCSVKEQTVPQDSEQLALVKGEVVEVLHRDISGWSFGRQVLPDGALKEGWFPDWASERLFSDELWVEQSVREFQSLEDRLRCLPRIPPQPDHGSVYDIYVDVFAAASGELMWNEDFHVDKSLTQQHLFTIQGKDDTPVLQYFNPADWMLGDRRSADECFDHRVTPILTCKDRTQKLPLGPSSLGLHHPSFKHVWALAECSTRDMKLMAEQKGYRVVSHQHVPEFGLGPNMSLSKNLHTFVREIGHLIKPETDRDSKILARFKLEPPSHLEKRQRARKDVSLRDDEGLIWRFVIEPLGTMSVLKEGVFVTRIPLHIGVEIRKKPDQSWVMSLGHGVDLSLLPSQRAKLELLIKLMEEEPEGEQAESTSILVVRFQREGEVVWVAPASVTRWPAPGQVLLVVKLAGSDNLVPVRVPSFDLRYEMETTWYPCKTLVGGGEFKKKVEKEVARKALKGKAKAKSKPKTTLFDCDGYSQGIFVAKHAFVCRIMKREGYEKFDRERSKSWYRSVLSDAFPEIASLPEQKAGDDELVKHAFLSRCMNMRRALSLDDNEMSMLKGHITVEAAKEGPDETQSVHMTPVQNLWLARSFAVSIYILTARGFMDLNKPYLKVGILGQPETRVEVTLCHESGTACDIYKRATLDVQLPGQAVMVLELWDETLTSEEKVGEARLDLEDRHLALLHRQLREATNPGWIKQNMSPANPIEVECKPVPPVGSNWIEPQEPQVMARTHQDWKTFHPGMKEDARAFAPRLGPPKLAPIEALELFAENRRQGTIRTWIDLFPSGELIPELQFADKNPHQFEIRIKVIQVDGISVFKDFGERNDVYLHGELHLKCVGKQEQTLVEDTDVHKYARRFASFNECWSFTVHAPTQFCTLSLELRDDDTVSGSDPLYARKHLALEPVVFGAYANYLQGLPSAGTLKHEVIFDSYPNGQVKSWTRCFCCRRFKAKPAPATLSLEICVLSRREAEERPMERQFAEPKGRITTATMIFQPGEFLGIVLGPSNVARLRRCCCISAITLVLLVGLAIAYLIIQGFVVPLK